jgi:putative transcriptional regulator
MDGSTPRAMDSLKGQLLIAGGSLLDPNFRRAVVLVGEHNEEGALGVVLNRPTSARVREAAPPLASLVGEEDRVFVGGPVQPEGAVVIAEFEDPDTADLLVFGKVGFLTGELRPDAAERILRARVFAGYAGWGPGQLEAEMETSSWILDPALIGDVFTDDADGLWRRVLRRKGPEFHVLSLMPADPSLN